MLLAGADFLPGPIEIERGGIGDYRGLSHLHYAAGDPATVAGVWRATYQHDESTRVVGVAVLSWPVPSSTARERAMGLERGRSVKKLRWLNAHRADDFAGDCASAVSVAGDCVGTGSSRALRLRCSLRRSVRGDGEGGAVL